MLETFGSMPSDAVGRPAPGPQRSRRPGWGRRSTRWQQERPAPGTAKNRMLSAAQTHRLSWFSKPLDGAARDLAPATAGIADELSRQYYLGYVFKGEKDGKWHAIRVQVRDGRYLVRSRRGFVASP